MLKITHYMNNCKRQALTELKDTGEPLFITLLQRLKATEKIEVYALINNEEYVTKIVTDVYSFILTETFEPIILATRWEFCFRRILHINVNTSCPSVVLPIKRRDIIDMYGWDNPSIKCEILSSMIDTGKETRLDDLIFELANGRLFWPTNSISIRFHGTISKSNTVVDNELFPLYNLNAKCIIGVEHFDEIRDAYDWSSMLKGSNVLSVYSPNCGEDIIIEVMCCYSATSTCYNSLEMKEIRDNFENDYCDKNCGARIIWN